MDKKNVLICSVQFDFHAAAVQWALERYGAQVHFCSMPDFTEIQEITASISDDVTHLSICGPDIKVNLQAIDSTWIRRPRNPKIPDFVHEADRKFAFRQAKDMHVGMLRHLSNSSFSVNPYDCGEQFNNKVSQLLLANRVGLHIPETIVSNSPDEIRAFFKTHQEEIIYKPLAFGSWIAPGKSASIATTRLKIGDLGDHQSLIACPGIFQRHIPKQFELRVNVLGRTIRAAKLQTQNEKTSVDWRFDFRGTTPPLSDFELPDGISQQCLAFMRESGLVFGCFDFIVDDKGEYVFLEVNQMGQFLWVEDKVPEHRLLDAFARLLLSGDREFSYTENSNPATLAEFKVHYGKNRATYEEVSARHIKDGLSGIYQEQATPVYDWVKANVQGV